MAMGDEPDGKRRGRRAVWITPVVIIAYMLSVGPAWWLVQVTGQRLLFVFYAPLWLLTGVSQTAREVLTSYMLWWHPR
jgi:hypothetical protein